jgi:hypothetical protein
LFPCEHPHQGDKYKHDAGEKWNFHRGNGKLLRDRQAIPKLLQVSLSGVLYGSWIKASDSKSE